MSRVEVSLKDFPERLRTLEKQFPKVVERGLREASLMLRGALVQIAIKQANPQPVDQGQYKQAWGGRDVPGGAQVFNLTKQAFFVERGRRKGKMPPHAPIREWVRRKGIFKDRFKELQAEAATAKRHARAASRRDAERRKAARKYAEAAVGRKAWRASEKRARDAMRAQQPQQFGPKTRRGFKSRRLRSLKNEGKSLPGFKQTFDRKTNHARAGARFTMRDRAINDVALLVRRAIAAHGTPEKRVLRNAVRRLKPKMPGILKRALRELKP